MLLLLLLLQLLYFFSPILSLLLFSLYYFFNMKVTIFFTTSTAFQYMSLYILFLLLLLLLSSPLQLFNTGSLLLKISLYYFEVTKFDNIFANQALFGNFKKKLLRDFQKITEDFYSFFATPYQGASTFELRRSYAPSPLKCLAP